MKGRTGIFLGTVVSFAFLIIYSFIALLYAIGAGNWDSGTMSMGEIVVILIFLLLLMANGICVILSLGVAGKTVYASIRDRQFDLRQFRDLSLGVYPFLLVSFLVSFDFSTLAKIYFGLPLQFLHGLLLMLANGLQ